MWENFEKKLMDISVAVHKNETKSRAHIEIRASATIYQSLYHYHTIIRLLYD